jgi:ubiquitin C-terminal hydrolase
MCLNPSFIKFPELLDLSKIEELKSNNGGKIEALYKLSGVIEHFGSAHGGHYVSYRPLFNH